MTDKIRTYRCDGCKPEEPCIAGAIDPDYELEEEKQCILSNGYISKANWKETGEYAIVKTDRGAAERAKTNFGLGLKTVDCTKLMEHMMTPNCSLCRWKEEGIGINKKNEGAYIETRPYLCTGQALKEAINCYNTPECQALYDPTDQKTRDLNLAEKSPEEK